MLHILITYSIPLEKRVQRDDVYDRCVLSQGVETSWAFCRGKKKREVGGEEREGGRRGRRERRKRVRNVREK